MRLKNHYTLSLIIFLLFLQGICFEITFSQILPFHSYTTKDGLLSNTITSLCQDSGGFLWIGTYDGVSRYDGNSFTNFTVNDGLAHYLVWCITESKRTPEVLYFGTNGGGISKRENGKFSTIRLGPDLESNQVSQIVQDSAGHLWCMTTARLAIAEGESLFIIPADIDSAITSNLVLSREGRILFATGRTIREYNSDHQLLRTITLPGQDDGALDRLYVDDSGDLWTTSTASMISHYRGDSLLEQRHMPIGGAGQIYIDPSGMIWLSLARNGVARIPKMQFATGSFEHLTERNGLHDMNIMGVMSDREGNIWLAGFTRGLAKLAEHNVYRFLPEPALTSNVEFHGAGLDKSGRFWAASRGGLTEVWNESDGWHQAFHTFPASGSIMSVTVDRRNDRIWVCRENGFIIGLRIENLPMQSSKLIQVEQLSPGVELPGRPVFGCYATGGNLWCMIDPDIVVVNLKTRVAKILQHDRELPINSARVLYSDRKGTMWIGGFGNGLVCVPYADYTQPMKHFSTRDGLPDNAIRAIIERKDSTLWFGTRYGGLAGFDGTTFQTISTRDGLISNAVWGLGEDEERRLWVATSLGLMSIDSGAQWRAGLHPELLGSPAWSCDVDAKGRIWSVTADGIIVFDAPRKRAVLTPPPIFIDLVTVNGKSRTMLATQALSYTENNIALHFVGLSYYYEKGNRYRYRLRGIDADWNPPTAERLVTYAALAPGQYTFDVTAINAEGIASTIPASVSFTIDPPFWRRWWFYAGFAVLVTITAGGTARYISTQRLQKQLNALEKERAVQEERLRTRDNVASDLHDDVAATLGSIALFTESLKRDLVHEMHPKRELVQKIATLLSEAQDAVSDIVWTTTPRHDTLQDLLWKIRDLGSEISTTNGLKFDIELAGPLEGISLSELIRKNVYLIFKEAMNNIVKHAGATAVVIRAEISETRFHFTIRDNGVGFLTASTSDSPRGHGLHNMQKRAREISADLVITSLPGKGTTLELTAKMA